MYVFPQFFQASWTSLILCSMFMMPHQKPPKIIPNLLGTSFLISLFQMAHALCLQCILWIQSTLSPIYMLYKFEIVNKKYGINSNEKETLQHYNIITSFVPYKNIIIYSHNKILLFSLTIYYLSYSLPTTILLTSITQATYLLSIT